MKAAFHTLGCKVNQYETESMKEQFAKAGFTIVDEEEAADVYVVNTCTVTNLADRKSRQFIRRCRKVNPAAVVAVTGCYAQIKPDEVAEIEGVQIVAGTDEKHAVLPLVQEYFAARDRDSARDGAGDKNHADAEPSAPDVLSAVRSYDELTTYEELGEITGMEGRTRAFIKIQEGCTHFCTYCIIPYARGTIRSRRKEEIREEVERLISKGYKEIVLTGINTAYYGRDLGYDGAAELIGELNSIPGEFRIRLSSLEPTVIDADYVKKLFPYEKLCHHLHLALQSGSDNVLKAMNRGYTRSEFLAIADELRAFDPHYGLSTDIIVGFPGETEEDFQGSEDITTRLSFCKTHVFKYSQRTGTPAAERPDQIDGTIKASRSRRLIETARRAADAFFTSCIGDTRTVLVEEFAQDPITGESQGMENDLSASPSAVDIPSASASPSASDASASSASPSAKAISQPEGAASADALGAAAADSTSAAAPASAADRAAINALSADALSRGTQWVTGYTDNYIRTYFRGDPSMFNEFVRVRLVRPYRDGMLGEVVE